MRASVCMATYNGEKYLKEQIESILCQLNENDELIISDDNSTDNTTSIIQKFNDPRIKLIHNKRHGFVSNFENALKHATGEYIFLSDQDDIWVNGKINKCIQLLQDNIMIIHDAKIIDQYGCFHGKKYFSTLHHHSSFFFNLYKTRFLGCCMAFKKDILQECLPFPDKIVAHDYWLGMYTLFTYPKSVLFLDCPLIQYRRHGNNVSSSSEKSRHNLFFKLITKRFNIICNIIKRSITLRFNHK